VSIPICKRRVAAVLSQHAPAIAMSGGALLPAKSSIVAALQGKTSRPAWVLIMPVTIMQPQFSHRVQQYHAD
jgi:hypothetical protein